MIIESISRFFESRWHGNAQKWHSDTIMTYKLREKETQIFSICWLYLEIDKFIVLMCFGMRINPNFNFHIQKFHFNFVLLTYPIVFFLFFCSFRSSSGHSKFFWDTWFFLSLPNKLPERTSLITFLGLNQTPLHTLDFL